mmetsp:Transcript_22478/g.36082  ORF Transcript_22478/g.36082 Transcript_22478/m.36082 type:complete len:260 (+) Transcript_22478:608-1387(+)
MIHQRPGWSSCSSQNHLRVHIHGKSGQDVSSRLADDGLVRSRSAAAATAAPVAHMCQRESEHGRLPEVLVPGCVTSLAARGLDTLRKNPFCDFQCADTDVPGPLQVHLQRAQSHIAVSSNPELNSLAGEHVCCVHSKCQRLAKAPGARRNTGPTFVMGTFSILAVTKFGLLSCLPQRGSDPRALACHKPLRGQSRNRRRNDANVELEGRTLVHGSTESWQLQVVELLRGPKATGEGHRSLNHRMRAYCGTEIQGREERC